MRLGFGFYFWRCFMQRVALEVGRLRGGVFYKLLLGALCSLAFLSSQAKAEESGVFVGAQVMYGDLRYSERYTDNLVAGTLGYFSSNNTAPGYGVVGGYKHFFNPFFGFRVYGQFFYNTFSFQGREQNYGATGTLVGGKNNLTQLNLVANVDVLFNFIVGERFNLGVFGGVGAGFQYWKSDRIDSMYKLHNSVASAGYPYERMEDGRFGFDLALSAGLRVNFLKVNTIEIGAKLPAFATRIFDAKTNYMGLGQNFEHFAEARQSYNAFVRYTFGF